VCQESAGRSPSMVSPKYENSLESFFGKEGVGMIREKKVQSASGGSGFELSARA